MTATPTPLYDVMIIGAGPAGMAAALICGRARLNTVVVHDNTARNLVTTASHGFLTRDGAHPAELAAAALEQLNKYPAVERVKATASTVAAEGEHFVVGSSAGGAWAARRVIVATGYKDDLARLNMPGIEAVYGKTVYPCPFCDGFEHKDERIAVFMGEGASHFVPVVRIWSPDVVVFSNGQPLPPEEQEALRARGVRFEEASVTRLVSDAAGHLIAVELEDGTRVERDAGFVGEDYSAPSTAFAEQLGVSKAKNDWGMDVLEADDAGKTNVPGIYIIGDSKSGFGGITAAAAQGASCAEHIVHDIAQERWAAALA